MRKAIFNQADWKLCNVPHPTTPPAGQWPSNAYPYAPTHVGVHYAPSGFNGSKVWLCASPYSGYAYENPCIWQSDDSEYPPKDFIPYTKNPIIGKIGEPNTSDFNSDPDVIIVNDELLVINRETYRAEPPTIVYSSYHRGVFTNGVLTDFEQGVKVIDQLDFENYNIYIASPAWAFIDGKYTIFDINSGSYNYADKNNECMYIRMSQAQTLGLDAMAEVRKIGILGHQIEPWHLSVFEYAGRYYSIICGTTRGVPSISSGRIYLAEFDANVKNLFIYSKPLFELRAYRSDAYVDENGLFVLYANTFEDTSYGGYSETRGKDIFVASMDFETLLKKLRS